VRKFLENPTPSKETSGFRMKVDGVDRDFLASVDLTKLGWGIFVQAEKRQAYSPVQAMIRSHHRLGGDCPGLALVFGFWLAASIARPINQLAETAGAFARETSRRGPTSGPGTRSASWPQTYNRSRIRSRITSGSSMPPPRRTRSCFSARSRPWRPPSTRRTRTPAAIRTGEQALASHGPFPGAVHPEIRNVQIGSLLHDVGRSESTTESCGSQRPHEDEYRYMKLHPEKGASLLAPIKNMKEINPAVRHHHERWDGGGYPSACGARKFPSSPGL